MRIAICDDDERCIETASQYLDKIGKADFEYDTFPSGEDLLKVYRESGCVFDVIFLDMEMEQLNGIETANHIRDFNNYMIGLQAYIDEHDFQRAKEYINTLKEKFKSGEDAVETGNTAFDAVLL